MRGNVLQTWTPAGLVLTAVLMVGTVATGSYREGDDEGRRASVPSRRVAYCAAPAPLASGRRVEVRPRQAAAMLLVLMAQRGRRGGLSR